MNVEYKQTGETAWRQALPLLRIGSEQIGRDRENLKYIVPEGFAGSILNLKPGTEYDIGLTLSDPDGASGETRRTFNLRTRSEPQAYSGGRTLHVYSPEHQRAAPGASVHGHS